MAIFWLSSSTDTTSIAAAAGASFLPFLSFPSCSNNKARVVREDKACMDVKQRQGFRSSANLRRLLCLRRHVGQTDEGPRRDKASLGQLTAAKHNARRSPSQGPCTSGVCETSVETVRFSVQSMTLWPFALSHHLATTSASRLRYPRNVKAACQAQRDRAQGHRPCC